mgnify:CR=1 FL=1
MYDIEKYYNAGTVSEAVTLLNEHPDTRIISGGSDVLIKIREGRMAGTSLVSIRDIEELKGIERKENGDIFVDMTVTSPMCPVAGILPQQAADAIALVKGTNAIEVKIVWEPAWSFERLSEEAKLMFEMF